MILLLLILTALSACSGKTSPEETVNTFLDLIKDEDFSLS